MGKKRELRAELLRRRAALTPDDAARHSAAVTARVLEWPRFQRAETVMAYADFRNEVQTGGIIGAALRAGKKVGLPVADVAQKTLKVVRIERYPDDLESGAYGIPEPRRGLPAIAVREIDLILAPGVGFDLDGYRLGFGGGYYDRFFRIIRRRTVKAGLAFDFQVCETIHPDSHDRGVHYIVTPTRTLRVPRRDLRFPVVFRGKTGRRNGDRKLGQPVKGGMP